MQNIYADFHIHIGRTVSGKAVKITGSNSLTLSSILTESSERKGLDMIGIIDSHVPEVIQEIENRISNGQGYELEKGGIRFDSLTLILGTEIEIYDQNCHGPIHVLVYLPNLAKMKHFSEWLRIRMKNINLSSQRIYEEAIIVQEKTKELGGLFIPAHIFTPFKSVYGKGVVQSISEVFDATRIDAVELGLSANTMMADQIEELHAYPFLTNSDAHSTPKIAREYQHMLLQSPSFTDWDKAIRGVEGCKIIANYGLNPVLGKYHETICSDCNSIVIGTHCMKCGSKHVIKGVSNRIKELSTSSCSPARPPYIHHVPLEFIPGIGPKTLDRLLDYFGTEMNILHRAEKDELASVVGYKLAHLIVLSRQGNLTFKEGGGGTYGKVIG
ncbi:endonuclease Q family protein [Pseudalkalibacillus hwajinpoensis]|uniref:TIGR00375 family protein n=1 Tax=Guptibacillus hwajinpoensis TaxID=208199 RepID=A0A4U1MGT2_9BACL|nr:endonuclease Q family protein [Pseudalkalibacillus hwajinpoensis]TKD69927.1 TIGR00375 family protein [Pseudalkalibacillus hwajinpoensis]